MKARVFVGTNVMLDFLGERHLFYESAAMLATLADQQKLTMVVSPISFAIVNYFIAKFESPTVAIDKLRKFKILSEISKLDENTVDKALNSSFNDFEDALQYHSAIESNCQVIITRNGKDFKNSQIPIMTADEYLKSLKNIKS